LCGMGATTMALPSIWGGEDATLVDLTVVAEEIGRCLAPVPWIDHVCGARLLARLEGSPAGDPAAVTAGELLVAPDPRLETKEGPRLVPAVAVAHRIITRDGDDVVALTYARRPVRVDNLGRLPMAWIDPATADDCIVLASGAAAEQVYLRMCDEWRLLTAAALVGLVEAALTTAAQFATTRHTLSVPIATLQAISHPLADIAVTVEGGRNLTRRAAWFLDNEPDERPELPSASFCFMAEEAPRAATRAAHVQGGLGVSDEAAASAYVLRARGWSLAGGDPAKVATRIAHLAVARDGGEKVAR
jgi:alkylation response protein AidB-like acyl-CoA dehydrogenase